MVEKKWTQFSERLVYSIQKGNAYLPFKKKRRIYAYSINILFY